jgi:glucose 1-dehydrogenase
MVNDLDNAELAQTVAEEIRAMGRQADVCIADAGNAEQVKTLVDATVKRFGKADIAVANAVFERHTPFLESDFENVRRTTDVLLFGGYYLAYYAARHMADRGEGGKILFITSIHGAHSFPNAAAYNMCKAGVNHLARSIANELSGYHINVNAIEPGWIDTPGERRFYTEEQMQSSGERLPWGSMGQPDDIAKAAAYLCSDDADYVTGTVLRADGGYMASLLPPLKSE